MDTKQLLQNCDLSRLIEADLGSPVKKGHWLFWRCPFHADKSPSLGVVPSGVHWYCFGCGKTGDAITWLREYQGMSISEACRELATTADYPPAYRSSATYPIIPEDYHVVDVQPAWKSIIHRCHGLLWDKVGNRARAYLSRRGLREELLHSPAFLIGHSPGLTIDGLYVERGIVLPCFTVTPSGDIDTVAYIKIRRPTGAPKYRKLRGGGSGLFGALDWSDKRDMVLTEGELDCLLLHQEAGDLAVIATLGSATDKLDFSRWGRHFLPAKRILLAYDNDPAGERGAESLSAISPRFRRIMLPYGKDVTDYWMAGGNLRDWVNTALKGEE